MEKEKADLIFSQLCEYYQISDFHKQIVNEAEMYRDHSKRLPQEELERSLKEGFYLGESKCRLGEFLSYSAIPYYLKQFFPDVPVYVCENPLSESIFKHNPYVDKICNIEGREPYGSFSEFGFGTQSQRRLRSFGIFVTTPQKPMVFPDPEKVKKYREWKSKLPLKGRKLIMVHSSGKTVKKIFNLFQWWHYLRQLKKEFYVVQIGSVRDQWIPAHEHLRLNLEVSDLMGLIPQADAFVGPNSGLMHIAAGLDIPSVILHNEIAMEEFYLPVLGDNEALPKEVNHHLYHLYPWHYHLCVDQQTRSKRERRDITTFSLETLRQCLHSLIEGKLPEDWQQLSTKFAQQPQCILKNADNSTSLSF